MLTKKSLVLGPFEQATLDCSVYTRMEGERKTLGDIYWKLMHLLGTILRSEISTKTSR